MTDRDARKPRAIDPESANLKNDSFLDEEGQSSRDAFAQSSKNDDAFKKTEDAINGFFESLEGAVNDPEKAARDLAQKLENIAASAAISREELWEKYQISDRLAGAALVGKFGILAGPLAKPAIFVAAVYGFFNGPKIVANHDKWLKTHKDKKAVKPQDPKGPKA